MWRLVTQGSAIQSMQGGRKLAAWNWAAEERVGEQGGTAETRTDGSFQPERGVDGAHGAHKQVGGSVVLGERLLTTKVITAVEIHTVRAERRRRTLAMGKGLAQMLEQS